MAMYFDSFPRLYVGSCVEADDVVAMSTHFNDLCSYPGWGTITDSDIMVPFGTMGTTSTSGTNINGYAWNTIIGTTPTIITFDYSLGTTGDSWAMTYTIYNSQGLVVDPIITNRTKDGFTVAADEDNVHFEGNAMLIG
jgi:hypothetical protein